MDEVNNLLQNEFIWKGHIAFDDDQGMEMNVTPSKVHEWSNFEYDFENPRLYLTMTKQPNTTTTTTLLLSPHSQWHFTITATAAAATSAGTAKSAVNEYCVMNEWLPDARILLAWPHYEDCRDHEHTYRYLFFGDNKQLTVVLQQKLYADENIDDAWTFHSVRYHLSLRDLMHRFDILHQS